MSEDLKWLRHKLKTIEFYMNKDWNKYKHLSAYRHFLIRDICNIQLKEFDRN